MKRGKLKRGGPVPKANTFSTLFRLAACGTVGLGAVGNSSAETVITFEGFSGINTPINSIPGYGDNIGANSPDWTISAGRTGVIGTPDITLDWLGSSWDTYIDWNGRGSVAQTDFGTPLSIVFTPSALSAVRLVSFQLDAWAGAGAGDIAWSLTGSVSGDRGNGNWLMSDAGGRSGLFPDVTGVVGETLTLNFILKNGAPSYFALDNLTFDQVPEPSTWALGALGAVALGAAAMRRRRQA